MALFRCSSGSGGGGGNIKSDTTEATTTANQEITINTGLSQINKFVWMAKKTTGSYLDIVVYDRDVDSSKFSYATAGRNQGEYNVAFKTSGNAYTTVMKSVSGGTVTLIASTNVNYRVDAGYWYAE